MRNIISPNYTILRKALIVFIFGMLLSVTSSAQIGYKYKKWIKNKEYLVAKGSQPWDKNLTLHEFNAIGKAFTSVYYYEYYPTKKITQVEYEFPTKFTSEIYKYCSKHGYCVNLENMALNNEDPIFENIEGTIQYRIQGYSLLQRHPDRVKYLVLNISTNSHYYKGTFGFE